MQAASTRKVKTPSTAEKLADSLKANQRGSLNFCVFWSRWLSKSAPEPYVPRLSSRRISRSFLHAARRAVAWFRFRCFSQVAAKRAPVCVVESISSARSPKIPHRPSHSSAVQAIVSERSSWRLTSARCSSSSVSVVCLRLMCLWPALSMCAPNGMPSWRFVLFGVRSSHDVRQTASAEAGIFCRTSCDGRSAWQRLNFFKSASRPRTASDYLTLQPRTTSTRPPGLAKSS